MSSTPLLFILSVFTGTSTHTELVKATTPIVIKMTLINSSFWPSIGPFYYEAFGVYKIEEKFIGPMGWPNTLMSKPMGLLQNKCQILQSHYGL